MLLPQRMTLYPNFLRNSEMVVACSASLKPKLMVMVSSFLPQPMKSKLAKETPNGMERIKLRA